MTTDTRAIVSALEGSFEHGPISTDARAIVGAINGEASFGPISTDARAIVSAFNGSFAYGPISTDARAIVGAIQGDTEFGPISRDARDIVEAIIANASPEPTPPPDPLTIFGADLAAWYDPSDAATVTQSGGLVSQLSDKSGNGYHLLATGNARPTYSATGILSNAPGLYFDGSANIMSAAGVTLGATSIAMFTLSELDEVGGVGNKTFCGYTANGDSFDFSSHSSIISCIKIRDIRINVAAAFKADSSTIPIVGAIQPIYTGIRVRFGSVMDGANSIVYVDNQASAAVAYTPAFNYPGTLSFGKGLTYGDIWKGYMGETVVLKRAPTSDERLQLNSWLIRSWSRVLICEGDSLVHEGPAGYGTVNGSVPGLGGYAYISVPNINPKVFLDVIAIGGSDMQSASPTGLIARRAAYLDNRIPANKYGKQYIVYFNVANNTAPTNLGVSDLQRAQAHAADVASYAVSVKAAGADKVVTGTLLSRTDAGDPTDAVRNIYNGLIMDSGWSGLTANGGAIDAVVPFHTDPIMGVDDAPTVNPTYFADGVHPSTIGHARLEPIFTATISSL